MPIGIVAFGPTADVVSIEPMLVTAAAVVAVTNVAVAHSRAACHVAGAKPAPVTETAAA